MTRPIRGAGRRIGTTVRHGGGTGGLVLLSILFWLIFYQNLPNSLQGMADNGPVVLANETDRLIKILMIVASVYYIASRWSMIRSLWRHFNAGAAAFLVLAPLSAVWSIEPDATLLRFVSLATIFMVSTAIVLASWHPRRFQQLALPPLLLILLASLAVGLVDPDQMTEIGTDISQKGAWHGMTHSKNEFGMMSSIAVIMCFNRVLAWEGRKFLALAGTAVAFVCLLLSKSSTSLLATIVALLAMLLVMRVPVIRERFSAHVLITIAAVILLYEAVLQDVLPGVYTLLSPITSLVGKDMSFSARTVIWNVVKEHIQYAPYLGTGYGAYWLGPFPSSPSYVFVPMMYFYPTEAHNGYLDVVNDLGLVGLMVVLLFIIWFIRHSLQLLRIDRAQAVLYVALLLQQMVMNMSESEWFSRTSTFSVLILATVCLARGLMQAHSPARAAGR